MGDIQAVRCSPNDEEFLGLVNELDTYLSHYNGPDREFYSGFNNLDSLVGAVVARRGSEPVGCGAFRRRGNDRGEVKRMYVRPDSRGQGIARIVLTELEKWAAELELDCLQLETGSFMEDARRLYESAGYRYIPNFPPYVGLEASVCMEKRIR